MLLWLGLRQHPDPVWLETGALLHERPLLLADASDSVQALYCDLHRAPFRAGDSSALRLIAVPYLSNLEWTSYRDLCRTAAAQRFIVISGVTGTRATRQAKHVGRLLAGREDNFMEIDCAPEFDLEYHKKYIGQEAGGQFQQGELLDFWDRARQNPGQRFVTVVDNFDKINPETFFGPEFWESLSSPRDSAVVGGKKVGVPTNFYLVSVTHLGPGSLVEFNEEHFKRLGRQYVLQPNARELLAGLRRQADELAAKPGLDAQDSSRLAALRDTAQVHCFLYYFVKCNQIIRERYAEGYLLGQGSNVKSLYRAEDRTELKRTYLEHINAISARRPLSASAFEPLDHTVRTGGLEPNSSFLARQVQLLHDTGYFVEVTVVLATAMLTALFGWWVFRRREQIIRRYGDRAQQIFSSFEKQAISAEVAARRLEDIKKEVDNLVMRRRLNYTEGLYFLAFIEDRVKRIEFARNISENFLELFNAFMEDNVLTESEYLKLRQFLQSIRHKIPADTYDQFIEKVERAYAMNN